MLRGVYEEADVSPDDYTCPTNEQDCDRDCGSCTDCDVPRPLCEYHEEADVSREKDMHVFVMTKLKPELERWGKYAPRAFARELTIAVSRLILEQTGQLAVRLAVAETALASVLDLHDPTNERFCPQCGWDTEAVSAFGPCPTVTAIREQVGPATRPLCEYRCVANPCPRPCGS